MKVVNLLCKGRSLNEFDKLPDAEFVVLANDFDREISKIKSLHDYLKEQSIHQVLNMVVGSANGYHSIDFFNKFNVVKLIRPYLDGIRTPGSSGQNIPLEEHFLQSHHEEFMYTGRKYKYDYPGTGMAAFAYSILDCSADVINIIGMDFYDNLNYGISNYLVDCPEGRDYKRDFWTTKEMQENFCKLVKANPDIKINMTTMCKDFIDEMNKIKNLNINIIGDM
tara:strand:+ start:272 stop:940 length:669 start_codon:yes stop_codon:yes gene_type:complete